MSIGISSSKVSYYQLTDDMIESNHIIYELDALLCLLLLIRRHFSIFLFRFLISNLHLDVLYGIIFGRFKFLIDLEFENDERIWFFLDC